MLTSGLNGSLVGEFSDVIRYLIPTICTDTRYVCRVNVLHYLRSWYLKADQSGSRPSRSTFHRAPR